MKIKDENEVVRVKNVDMLARMTHFSSSTLSFEVYIISRSASWLIFLLSPSLKLCELRSKPMFDIYFLRYPSLATLKSSIKSFSEVLEPFEIMSKVHFLSVTSWSGISRLVTYSSSDHIINATSNMSLNAITSALEQIE